MPLQSNVVTEYANCVSADGSLIGRELSRVVTFTVTPNPCNNTGNHVDPTPYSYQKVEDIKATGFTVYKYYGGGTVRNSSAYGAGACPGTAAYFLAEASDPYNKALAKVVDQIKNSDLNISTSVGEGRETLEMLGGIAKSAFGVKRRLVDALKSGKPGARVKDLLRDGAATLNDLKAIGGGWLYFSLGVQPLLADIEALRSHVLSDKAEEVKFSVKGRASETADVTDVGPWSYYSSPTYSATKHLVCADSRRCEIGVTVSITDLHSYENWRAGIGIRPTLAWELMTLSFLADYFVKIGEYLELMEAALYNNGFSFLSGYVTTTRKRTSYYTCEFSRVQGLTTYPYTEGGLIQNFGRSDGGKILIEKSRVLLKSFPAPRHPRLTIPRASTQLLNVAALLSQTLSRGKT